MIRHVALFTFTDTADPADIERLADALTALTRTIPEIASFSCGADLGVTEGSCDFALVADFRSLDDYRTYADHPDHLAVIRDHVAPIVADRVRIQFEH